MPPVRLELFHVSLPLKKAIKHASHSRQSSDSFVVRATLQQGTVGYGEGVPRHYVTGETIETCFRTIESCDVARTLGRPTSFEDVVSRLDSWTLPEIQNDPRGMFGNAARCAVELALLDAYGRYFGRSLGEVARLSRPGGPHAEPSPRSIRYSGAITAEGKTKETISAWKQRLYGFRQVKIKVGVPGQDDADRLARFRRILGRQTDLRVDANESWKAADLREHVSRILPFTPSALEQPIAHEEIAALTELRPSLGLPVMLDESLCGLPDGRKAIENGWADLFNVRLSKCGGFLPSLALIDMAFRAGLGVQLGCHPGESVILSAAGRALACNIKGLRYLEGSYDRHVLRENLSHQDITFRYGGHATPLPGPGLGVDIDPVRLESLALRRAEVPYD